MCIIHCYKRCLDPIYERVFDTTLEEQLLCVGNVKTVGRFADILQLEIAF